MKQEAWMANMKGTDVTLSRRSLQRLVRVHPGSREKKVKRAKNE
jgi:hypothetical protein